jgi:hypothetical protein
MIRLALQMLGISVLVSGCDPAYGPKIGNDYGSGIELMITYADGEMATAIWPACARGFIGKPGTDIVRLSIAKSGQLQREFNADEIRVISARENSAPGYATWNIGPVGTSLITNEKDDPCFQR